MPRPKQKRNYQWPYGMTEQPILYCLKCDMPVKFFGAFGASCKTSNCPKFNKEFTRKPRPAPWKGTP